MERTRLQQSVYELENPVKQYRIENRISKEVVFVFDRNAQDACKQCGWMIGDCFIKITGQ